MVDKIQTEDWQKKAELFFNRQIPVFVKLRNGRYFGGLILRLFSDGFDVDDIKLGDYPITYSEIIYLDKQKDKEEVSQ